MTLLKRYVLFRFIQTYLLTLSGFIGIFLIIDVFEQADEFVVHKSPLADWLGYFCNKLPLMFSYMAPQAVLLATVIALTSFARHNEFTAMKACGIGVTGITTPIIVASLFISLIVLANNEFVMPKATERMNYIFLVNVRKGQPPLEVKLDRMWFRSPNGTIWNVNLFDPERSMMRSVSIFSYSGKHFIEQRIDAAAAFWNGREWEFLNGYVRLFGPHGLAKTEYFDKRIFPVSETPEDFKKIQKQPDEMSAREMYRDIQTEEEEGNDTTRTWVDLNQKLSYPFMSLVLALIGIPLSLRTHRSGGLFFCIGVSLAVGLAFSFIYALGISLGHGGTFGPLLAAWGPITLYIAAGLYLILTIDSEKLLPF